MSAQGAVLIFSLVVAAFNVWMAINARSQCLETLQRYRRFRGDAALADFLLTDMKYSEKKVDKVFAQLDRRYPA